MTTDVASIDERKRAEASLRRANEKLVAGGLVPRQLLARLIDAQEEERHRIALNVHDDAVQVMAAANIRLGSFAERITDKAESARLEALVESISLATSRLRRLIYELEPPGLERDGLVSVILTRLEVFADEAGIATSMTGSLPLEPSTERGLLVYRMLQEVLANVRKHSRATAVVVEIGVTNDEFTLSITDDGVGFETPEPADGGMIGHLGLASICERARLAGGDCVIDGRPGEGARVEFRIPLRGEETKTPAGART